MLDSFSYDTTPPSKEANLIFNHQVKNIPKILVLRRDFLRIYFTNPTWRWVRMEMIGLAVLLTGFALIATGVVKIVKHNIRRFKK